MKLSSTLLPIIVSSQLLSPEYTQEFNQYANEIISPDVDGYEINPEYLYDLPTVEPPPADFNDTDIDMDAFSRTMSSASRLRPYQNQNNNYNNNKNNINSNKVNNNKNNFFNKYNNYKGNKQKKTTTTPEPTTTTTTTTTSIYTTTTTTTTTTTSTTTTVWSTTTSPGLLWTHLYTLLLDKK